MKVRLSEDNPGKFTGMYLTEQDKLALRDIAVKDGSFSMSASVRRLIRQEADRLGLSREHDNLQGS